MKNMVLLILVSILMACSSKPKDMYSDLYLRSEFTWWEAKSEYKFKPIADTTNKIVTTKIEADGNPYHIKVADKQWSKNKNCGYKKIEDRKVVLGKWLELDCTYDFEKLNSTPIQKPLELKPKETGYYTFILKMSTTGPSHIQINKVESFDNLN
ncbi:hypothetical protein RT723_04210 [Psychrosphaera aquimarina]|uniref:Lipoprotein n=1 Tax=Psychrosphaera aquimarina TaxID=2044854 RepID=A0ABU3QXS1_9GAMM|nr:hypothetical protein [Psychrosphaera aquimarina]MDU0112213.1 hypothetical protein [Psychrosphaera aquimarina]